MCPNELNLGLEANPAEICDADDKVLLFIYRLSQYAKDY